MKNIIFKVGLACLFFTTSLGATPEEDFERYAPLAQLVYAFTGVPPSIQLAQAYNEHNFGRGDTIGTIYHNVFSIMDSPYDEWRGANGWRMDAYGRKSYLWRRYTCNLHAWLDYARFMVLYAPRGNRWATWERWVENPMKYGASWYWRKVQKTIIEHQLYKYDYYYLHHTNY